MRNVRLILEYDGTDYFGYQLQPNGPTIQGALEKAVRQITRQDVTIYAAGRTDTGVHALGQVCSFRTDTNISEKGLLRGINALLPVDISVKNVDFVDPSFHARYSAKSRSYTYRILNREAPSALEARYAWHIRQNLNVDAMKAAASYLVGTHDFSTFANVPCVPNTVRTVNSLSIHKENQILSIDINANGFLRSMVRNITGCLAEVGLGKRNADDITRLLEAGDRRAAGLCAPPQGLFFIFVEY